jgi:hypothetical protein
MARYYAYCQKHGQIGAKYNNPNTAAEQLEKHLLNVSENHGKVDVIEEYLIEKYGQKLASLRKYKKR